MNLTPLSAAADAGQAASSPLITDQQDLSNQFLTLLTTQIENQDPLDPMDGNQFVEQLATISGLEQQVETNRQLADIVELLRLQAGETPAE